MHQAWQTLLWQKPTAALPLNTADNTIFNLQAEALLHIHGPDARDFLQSQFSNDIHNISVAQGQLSGYCNPKGRLIALLRIYPDLLQNSKDQADNENQPAGYFIVLPHSLAEIVEKRLCLYRMRAHVQITSTSDIVHFGVMGTDISGWLEKNQLLPDKALYSCRTNLSLQVVRVGPDQYDLVTSTGQAIKVWQELVSDSQTGDIQQWQYSEIMTGHPAVYKDTSELFIPQMLNLDLLDAISFSKGCYPGQEIIARMRYLGRNRQRMLRYSCDTDIALTPGMPLYGNDENRKIGAIVDAVADTAGSYQLLATVKLDDLEQPLHAGSAQGPLLSQQTLSSEIPELQPQ